MLIGITGGIGSGKSEVTAYLRNSGEVVICADEVAKQVVQPGELGALAIRQVFGDNFFDSSGNLDRKKLADHVFADKDMTSKLNDLLHPIIIDRIFAQAAKYKGRVFVDAALLIQSGMHLNMDCVWLVTADREKRIERVMRRDNAERQSVLLRMNNQLSDSDMAPFADEVIVNDGSIEELHAKLNNLLQSSMYKEDSE